MPIIAFGGLRCISSHLRTPYFLFLFFGEGCPRSPYSRFEIKQFPFLFLCTLASLGALPAFAIASIVDQVQTRPGPKTSAC